ncbi:hypothetical protein [Flavobacterium pedocola]
MKKIALLLLLVSFSMSAQDSFDVNKLFDDIRDINSGYARKMENVDLVLFRNSKKLAINEVDIEDPAISEAKEELLKLSEKEQKKINKVLSFSYFEKRWESQKSKRDKLLADKQKKNEESQNKNDGNTSKEEPYDILRRSLLGISKNPNFTVFRNIDYNFANTAFSWYLQEEMRLASKDYTTSATLVTETYIPKASSKNESLKVSYHTTIKENIQGLHSSKKVRIIDSVEIVGTTNLIIDLFVNYWNDKITIGGNKEGEIANRQFLGDHVSLIRMKNNLCKITITKGNMDVNYETTYGIHKPIVK